MDDRLGERMLVVKGGNDSIRQDIVHAGRASGRGIAHIVHLHRRRPKRKYRGATILGMAIQVDRYVNFVLAHQLGHVSVLHQADIIKMIERPHQPGPHVAAVIGAQGNSIDRKGGPVVPLQKLHQLMGNRVIAEIRRDIGNAYLVMLVRDARARPITTFGAMVPEMSPGATKLKRRIGAVTQQRKG